MQQTVVELEGVNGEWFTLAGPQAGDQGVYLATGVTGLYDPPVKVVYEEPGNFPGARYLNHRILRRDIVFGVEILDDTSDSWLSRDSQWRKAWAYDTDCTLYVTTEESGTRWLKLRLGEQPDISLEVDPNGQPVNRAGMVCIAGDPFWYENDAIYTATTQTNTTTSGSETLHIVVNGVNPTDQAVWPQWVLPAPGKWTIPDYSFQNDDLATRRITMPTLAAGEDCVVNTDPRVEQVVAANDAPVWARMNGVRFRNPIPPYTRSGDFEITATGCAAGQLITLRVPRPWSRPWGLA